MIMLGLLLLALTGGAALLVGGNTPLVGGNRAWASQTLPLHACAAAAAETVGSAAPAETVDSAPPAASPAYQRVLDASRRGDWEACLTVLDAARAEHTGGLLARSLHAASLACSRAGQWETAQELVLELEATGLKPRIDAYNAVIRAAGRARQPAAAVALLGRMREAGTEPNAVSYACAIEGLREARDHAGCVAMLQSMRDRGVAPNKAAFSSAVAACRLAGKGRVAARLLKDAQAAGLTPTEGDFVSAMTACVADKAGQEGVALWNRLRALEAEGAVPPLSSKPYTAAIALKAMAADARGAVELLSQMEAAGLAPDCVAYNTALRACGRAKDLASADALLRRMRAAGVQPDGYAYAAAISACGTKQRRALALVAEAEAAAEALGQGPPALPVYGAALDSCARAGAGLEALGLLRSMRARGVAPDVGCCGAALHALQAAGEWKEVHELLYTMRKEGIVTPDTLRDSNKALWNRAKRELGLGSRVK